MAGKPKSRFPQAYIYDARLWPHLPLKMGGKAKKRPNEDVNEAHDDMEAKYEYKMSQEET